MMSNADYDSLYHCCRWCKWYQGGKCLNEAFKVQKDTTDTYKIAEDGRLSGVIEETLGSMKQDKAERESLLLSWLDITLVKRELMRLYLFSERLRMSLILSAERLWIMLSLGSIKMMLITERIIMGV